MNPVSVGIDVSKGKSMVAAMRPFGEVAAVPHEVSHTTASLKKLVALLAGLEGELRIVMEATGRYHEPMAAALHEAGFFVSVVNPKLIKDFGNNTLRKVKTDKADAIKIARYGLQYWEELRDYSPEDETRHKLKEISRQYELYNKTKVALKNNLIALVDQIFPGVNKLFDSPVRPDGHQKWVDFVTAFWHCDCVRRMSEAAFVQRYRKWCKHNRYYPSGATAIYRFSRGLYATLSKNADTKWLITQAAAQVTTVSKAVEAFRAKLLRLAATLPEYPVVMALYGVGDTLGPQLMAEIGDVRRFAKAKSLTAFAGVDPGNNQSGTHDQRSVPTTKRGSGQLRRALFLAMSVYLQRAPADQPVYQFLDRKRAEGKKYYVYMTAAANKFLRIYYARVMEHLRNLDTQA